MEQYIGIFFIPIGLLIASISILEKNFMFGIDDYVYKFNKKNNVEVDKNTYCRFEGIQRVKTATILLIVDVVYLLFEIKDLQILSIMLFIGVTIDLIFYYINRKKFINKLKSQL